MGQRREIGILARDHAVARFQFDRDPQVLVGVGEIAGEALGERQRVVDVVRAGRELQRLFQVRARLADVARVDQRDAVVVVLLGGAQIERRRLLQAAVAHRRVQPGTLRHVALRAVRGLLKQIAGLLELARVKELHGGFERGQLFGPAGNRDGSLRLVGRLGIRGSPGCLGFCHAPVSVLRVLS